MATDLSLIPQNRIAELVSKLSSLESSITTNNNNAVHKTGNETVAGNKTFSGTTTFNNGILSTASNSGIMITNPNYTQGTAPSSSQWGRIDFRDKNNVEMAQCLTGVDNTNRSFAALWVHSPKASDTSSKWMLTAQCDTNGNYSLVSGVTPATSDNSTKIATTAYVRNQNYVPQSSLTEAKVVITTYINGTSWYRVWSDGWIEQGGQFAGSTTIDASTTTVTFIKPFTSYVAIAGGFTKSSNNATYGQNLWQNGNTTLTTMVCSLPAYGSNGNVSHAVSAGTGYWYACGY